MNLWLRNILLLALMLAASGAAVALRPKPMITQQSAEFDLEKLVPAAFADWQQDMRQHQQLVNPVQEETIKRVYDQILTRTYIGPDNYKIMLSIAYGKNQRSGEALAVHYPEVCYPAQGFEVKSSAVGKVESFHRSIPVRRLETQQGSSRKEPVTYWTTIGEYVTLGGLDRRLLELKYGIEGKIPDGLLFRVSSIDSDSAKAFSIQEEFIKDLLNSLPPQALDHLAGSGKQ